MTGRHMSQQMPCVSLYFMLLLQAIPFARQLAMKKSIFIDLVPSSAWFSNLRSELTAAEWDVVRRVAYQAAGYVCEVCGDRGPKHPVECHERWEYNEATRVQTLVGTIALCPACHEVTHFGLAQVRGRCAEAKRHLMAVSGWTTEQADVHIAQAFALWARRSAVRWKLDARWLLDGFTLSEATRQKILAHAAGSAPRRMSEKV